MDFKRKFLTGAAIIAMGSFVTTAQAASIKSLMSSNGDFLLEDDSGEYHIDTNGNGVLDAGDRLRGVIEWPKLTSNGNEYLLDGVNNEHLSALFEVEVTAKVATITPGFFNFSFGPSAAFAAEFGYTAGTMIAMYTDNVDNVNVKGPLCQTSAQIAPGGTCEASVLDGTFVAELGFTGTDGDEGWQAFNSPDDTSVGGAVGEATSLGTFNYNLSILSSNLGGFNDVLANPFVAGGVGAVDGRSDLTGSGQLLGVLNSNGERVSGYDFTDDADIQGNHIPEPSSIALFGLAVLGLAGMSKRKKA